jgi:hypothetical protein
MKARRYGVGHDQILVYCRAIDEGWSHTVAMSKAGIHESKIKRISNPLFLAKKAEYDHKRKEKNKPKEGKKASLSALVSLARLMKSKRGGGNKDG